MRVDYSDAIKPLIIALLETTDESVPIFKTTIQKVLYSLKNELPEDNKIRRYLPYYWYLHGPHSDIVKNSIYELEASGILTTYETSMGKKAFRLAGEVSYKVDDDLKDAIIRSENILRKVRRMGLNAFIKKIYDSNAPTAFIPMFKLKFLDPLEDYSTYHRISTKTIESLENVLYDSEANLPSDALFDEFNPSFSSFVTSTSRILNFFIETEEPKRDPIVLNYIFNISSENVWWTFANGIRIIDHDEFYNNSIMLWEAEYGRYLSLYSNKIDEFYDNTRSLIKPPCNMKPGKILSSLINGYMS